MKPSPKIDALLQAYFSGKATPEQLHILEDWLREDAAHVQLLVDLALLDGLMLDEQKNRDAAAILTILREAEEHAQPVLVDLTPADKPVEPIQTRQAQDPITLREVYSVAGYLAGQALRSKAVVIGSMAAVLLLGVTLYLSIVGLGGSPDPQQSVQAPPRESVPTVPQTSRVVATLTATHNARWAGLASSAPNVGDPLAANRRLTLTAGFAEITTARGAVVILEAPATIQLTDSDNALRLLTGKLVGICETESSKGFVVRTNRAMITDLGTEFGVEVGTDGQTYAAVFTGEIQISERNTSPQQPVRSISLTAGWSCQVSNQGVLASEALPLTARDQARFAKSLDEVSVPGYAYRRAVLASEPVVYWGFDEGNGQTANLAGQDQWAGHAVGQTDHASGLFGSALRLTGEVATMGGFASKSPLTLPDPNRYTLEAWCWVQQPHHGRVMSLADPIQGPGRKPLHFNMLEVIGGDSLTDLMKQYSPSVRFLHRNTSSEQIIAGDNVFAKAGDLAGQWVHIVAVRDSGQARVYINGKLVSMNNDEPSEVNAKQVELMVGVSPVILVSELVTNPTEFRPFHGLIDEVAVYDRALSAETIQAHYQLGRPSDGGQSLP